MRSREAGANPSGHWGEGRVQPGQVYWSITGRTHRDKQPFMLTFTPTGNLQQFRVIRLWEEAGARQEAHAGTHTHTNRQDSYYCLSFLQDLVVLAEGGQEDEGGDIFKAVNPLPTLWLLTTYVHNPVREAQGKEMFEVVFIKVRVILSLCNTDLERKQKERKHTLISQALAASQSAWCI